MFLGFSFGSYSEANTDGQRISQQLLRFSLTAVEAGVFHFHDAFLAIVYHLIYSLGIDRLTILRLVLVIWLQLSFVSCFTVFSEWKICFVFAGLPCLCQGRYYHYQILLRLLRRQELWEADC